MDETLSKVKSLVEGYKPKREGDHIRVARALVPVVRECIAYVQENSRTDRGCSQRMARELDQLLIKLPGFSNVIDEKGAHQLHNRRLADEHLEKLSEHLQHLLKEEEEAKKREIHDWVHAQPVLGKLKKICSKRLPKTAYVLLFRRGEEEGLELISITAKDGRVFTRLRPADFVNVEKVHRHYVDKPAVVGGAVIAEKELIATIGDLPQAAEGQDQLQALLSVSSEVASRPAKDFVEENAVLKELHELARQRNFPKESYILLFQKSDESSPLVVIKEASEGKVVTRFWPVDFVNRHKLFDNFRGKSAICGAAVIKHSELLQVIGELPQPEGEENHLEFLTKLSWTAVEKPYIDFVENNEVLKGLHELANSEAAAKNAEVVVFAVLGGRLEALQIADSSGRLHTRMPLTECLYPKAIYDRFSRMPEVVGASVISASSKAREKSHGRDHAKKPAPGGPRQAATEDRPVVLAAFGRSPLKVNLVATPENFKRLGINL